MTLKELLGQQKDLNEGYFLSSKYKNESVIEKGRAFIKANFSEKFASDLLFSLDRTEVRKSSKLKGKDAHGYSTVVDVENGDEVINNAKISPDTKYKIRKSMYKRAIKNNIDKQKIYLADDNDKIENVATFVHEIIHNASPYTPIIKQVNKRIFDIVKNNWDLEDAGIPFNISTFLAGYRLNYADKVSECLTYIISNEVHTECLTEEGTEALIKYLKTCGILNPLTNFWRTVFSKMRIRNKNEDLRKELIEVNSLISKLGMRKIKAYDRRHKED